MPKPLAAVGGLPLVWHVLAMYRRFGYQRFVLCLGHEGYLIRRWFGRSGDRVRSAMNGLGPAAQWFLRDDGLASSVEFVDSGPEAGTATRIRDAIEAWPAPMYAVAYADVLSDIDLTAQLSFQSEVAAAAVVASIRPVTPYGELITGPDHVVTEFREKQTASSMRVNGGFFILPSSLIQVLGSHERGAFEDAPVGRLVRDRRLRGYEHDGFWIGVDSGKELAAVNDMVRREAAPWILPA